MITSINWSKFNTSTVKHTSAKYIIIYELFKNLSCPKIQSLLEFFWLIYCPIEVTIFQIHLPKSRFDSCKYL